MIDPEVRLIGSLTFEFAEQRRIELAECGIESVVQGDEIGITFSLWCRQSVADDAMKMIDCFEEYEIPTVPLEELSRQALLAGGLEHELDEQVIQSAEESDEDFSSDHTTPIGAYSFIGMFVPPVLFFAWRIYLRERHVKRTTIFMKNERIHDTIFLYGVTGMWLFYAIWFIKSWIHTRYWSW